MKQQAQAIPAQSASGAVNGERLESWKEIAGYLRHSVRTVKRWERSEDLPVHRHAHNKSASVYAFRSEIEAWRGERNPARRSNGVQGAAAVAQEQSLRSLLAARLPCLLQAAVLVLLFNVLFRLLASR